MATKKRKAEGAASAAVPWLEDVGLEACTHKKLKSYAKKAGIAANQSGKALVAALQQHAVDPSLSGARSVTKQEADAAKRFTTEAAVALEVELPQSELVTLDLEAEEGTLLQVPAQAATLLRMLVGEYCVVAVRGASASKLSGLDVRLVAIDAATAATTTAEPCATIQYKGATRRQGVGNAFGKGPTESWTLRALRAGEVGLVTSRCVWGNKTEQQRF